MFTDLIISCSREYIRFLKYFGFTRYSIFDDEIYINDVRFDWSIIEVRIAFMDAGLEYSRGQLYDVIGVLAANGANLETLENVPTELLLTPMIIQLPTSQNLDYVFQFGNDQSPLGIHGS